MRSILEVITPAATQDITVLASVKERLGITTTAQDSKLNFMLKQCSDAIASRCNRVFAKETVRETFFLEAGESVESIRLKRYPVFSITSIVSDGTTLAGSDYMVDKEPGILINTDTVGATRWEARKIVVTYVGGYDLINGFPYDIEDACLKLVTHSYSAAGRDPLAKRIEIPDVQTTDYWVGTTASAMTSLPPEVEALIAPYRDWNL